MDAASPLVTLQNKRHAADYDMKTTPTVLDVREYIAEVKQVTARFQKVQMKHRKAFAAYLLINQRERTRG